METPAPSRLVGLVLFLAAAGVTLGLLPYAFARALVLFLLAGQPEAQYVATILVGSSAVALLARRLAQQAGLDSARNGLFLLVLVGWTFVNGGIVGSYAGSMIPVAQVLAVYLPASLLVPWLAWWPWGAFGRGVRVGGAVLTGLALVACMTLFEVEGLTGSSHINFVWRGRRTTLPSPMATPRPATPDTAITPELRAEHDFPSYLGPARTAVLPTVPLDADWTQHAPRVVWRRPVGAGWSSCAVVGTDVFTQEQRDADECVVSYSLATGAERWVQRRGVRFDSTFGGLGPRATPSVVDDRLYAVGATGWLDCLDRSTGQRVWSVDFQTAFAAKNLLHGVCGSPEIVDDLVLVAPTAESGPYLAAYDRAAGSLRWQAGDESASYASPQVVTLAGERQILLHAAKHVVAHDLSGRRRWRFPWTNGEHNNASQPIVSGDRVLASTGYGQGCVLLSLTPQAGEWQAESRWQNRNLKTKFTTAVLLGDHAYGLDEGVLCCLDLATGQRRWRAGRYGHGQILLAGDWLVVLTESGEVVLVRPRPERLDEVARCAALSSKTWNHPALAWPYLLVRNDRELVCLELRRATP